MIVVSRAYDTNLPLSTDNVSCDAGFDSYVKVTNQDDLLLRTTLTLRIYVSWLPPERGAQKDDLPRARVSSSQSEQFSMQTPQDARRAAETEDGAEPDS